MCHHVVTAPSIVVAISHLPPAFVEKGHVISKDCVPFVLGGDLDEVGVIPEEMHAKRARELSGCVVASVCKQDRKVN